MGGRIGLLRWLRESSSMSFALPHLDSGWAVDQAILSEEERVVVLRFGHDWNKQCMAMDEVLYSVRPEHTMHDTPTRDTPCPSCLPARLVCLPAYAVSLDLAGRAASARRLAALRRLDRADRIAVVTSDQRGWCVAGADGGEDQEVCCDLPGGH